LFDVLKKKLETYPIHGSRSHHQLGLSPLSHPYIPLSLDKNDKESESESILDYSSISHIHELATFAKNNAIQQKTEKKQRVSRRNRH
jgi:hypothetical protein